MLLTLMLTILVAVPLGVCSVEGGSWIDRTIMAFAVFAFSLPSSLSDTSWPTCLRYSSNASRAGLYAAKQRFWPWLQNLILPAVGAWLGLTPTDRRVYPR